MAIVSLSILAVLCIGSLTRPAFAITLMLLMFALEQSLQGSVATFRQITPLANFIVAVTAGISVALAFFRQHRAVVGYFTRTWFLTMVIFVYAIISLKWTPATEMARDMTMTGLPYLVLCILVAPLLVDSIGDFRQVAGLVLVFGIAVAGTILANPEFTIRSGRLGINLTATVRSNPLAIGELGGMLMIFAMLFRGSGSRALWLAIRVIGFGAGAVLALYSGSRGQVLFASLVGLAIFPIGRKVRSVPAFIATSVVLLLVAAALVLVAAAFLDPDLSRRWDSDVLASGTEVRRQNILDLVRAWAVTPGAWIFGLGWNAFSAVTEASSEPYSHSLLVDIPCELGLPMLACYLVILSDVTKAARRIFAAAKDDPVERSTVATLIALAVYQFMLSNKQGHLWGVCQMFMVFLWLVRVDRRDAKLGAPAPAPGQA